MTTWQVSILVALIGQLPVLITLFRVNQVHGQVSKATNGQHDELVHNQQDMIRRMEAMEEEINTVYKAVLAERMRTKSRWRG